MDVRKYFKNILMPVEDFLKQLIEIVRNAMLKERNKILKELILAGNFIYLSETVC